MHELSLALEVIDLVSEEAGKNSVRIIHSVEIEVGEISGVDVEAFQFSLALLAKESILKDAEIRIDQVAGRAQCNGCGEEFLLHDLISKCPVCGGFASRILAGKEFRVRSIIAQ